MLFSKNLGERDVSFERLNEMLQNSTGVSVQTEDGEERYETGEEALREHDLYTEGEVHMSYHKTRQLFSLGYDAELEDVTVSGTYDARPNYSE